jgi:hypothetical protein
MAKREQTNHPRTKPSNSQVADIPKVPSARTPISQKSEPAARKLAIHKRKHGSCCDEWMAHDPFIASGAEIAPCWRVSSPWPARYHQTRLLAADESNQTLQSQKHCHMDPPGHPELA